MRPLLLVVVIFLLGTRLEAQVDQEQATCRENYSPGAEH